MARKWAVEFKNLKEIKTRFHEIARAISAEKAGSLRSVSDIIIATYTEAAWIVKAAALRNASSGRVPRRLYVGARPAIFAVPLATQSIARIRVSERSSMVGVRTGAEPRLDRAQYKEWGGSKGNLKGMSLGRIFESGTHRGIKPVKYFRSAVLETKGKVVSILTNAYKHAILRLNK